MNQNDKNNQDVEDYKATASGKELRPQYMRDGFVMFMDTTTGTYVRTVDNDETHERCILLEYEDS